MRKFWITCLAVCMASAALFACCLQTGSLISWLGSLSSHACCQKSLPSESSHRNCDCHHDLAAAPSFMQMAQTVERLSDSPAIVSFDVDPLMLLSWVQPGARYLNGPPPDEQASRVPLYFRHHNLRL